MTVRVRAVLITASGDWLVFRRIRPQMDAYWSLPGGGVESTDASLEMALLREVREEVGGAAVIHSLRYIFDTPAGRQYVFLARIAAWSESERTGSEFDDPYQGEYLLEELPLTSAMLATIALRPPGLAELLIEDLRRAGGDLFALPDLRQGGPGVVDAEIFRPVPAHLAVSVLQVINDIEYQSE